MKAFVDLQTAVNVREHAESDERIKSLEAALASAQQQTAQSDLISRLKADELVSSVEGTTAKPS